ncbi:MAG: glucose 1-dehydrogenase, partial [Dehalococcoidia bacterium]
ALVTGAAAGIGRAIALELANEGACVAVNDIDLDGAERVAAEIKAAGRDAMAVRADVGASLEVNDMVKAVLDRFGRVDILVNNAGGTARERGAWFHESREEVWDYVIGLNLKGVMNCCRAVINPMMARRSGRIINIGSMVGVNGRAGMAEYCAAKAGVIGFTKALAKEVAAHGMRVVCVSPGMIETAVERQPAEARDRFVHMPPVGRIGRVGDIARFVAYLASEDGSYITGHNIVLDGGLSLMSP